jgi:hypothetical protein
MIYIKPPPTSFMKEMLPTSTEKRPQRKATWLPIGGRLTKRRALDMGHREDRLFSILMYTDDPLNTSSDKIRVGCTMA